MEAPLRLESLSPDLGQRIRGADEPARAAAVLAACRAAVAEAELEGDEIDTALALIEAGGADRALARALHAASIAFDDEYFELSDDEDAMPAEALHCFGKARATVALAYAVSGNRAELAEALYEAISALDDQGAVLERIAAALGGRDDG